jgi:hypothetical protein
MCRSGLGLKQQSGDLLSNWVSHGQEGWGRLVQRGRAW